MTKRSFGCALAACLFTALLPLRSEWGASAQAPSFSGAIQSGYPGQTVTVGFNASGFSGLVGFQVDVLLNPSVVEVARNVDGSPDCVAGSAAVGKPTGADLLPVECQGEQCERLRFLVFDTDNSASLGNGVLFSCDFTINPLAPEGFQALVLENQGATNSSAAVVGVTVSSGGIDILDAGC